MSEELVLNETTETVEKQLTPAELSKEQKTAARNFEIAMRKAQKERNEQIKNNKVMIQDLNLEVSFWKAKADLLRYRYEMMDFFIKSQEMEPLYLLSVEKEKLKSEAATEQSKPILS